VSAPILKVNGVSKRFGGFTALDGVELELGAGERLGLIGPNGSGKTTLINCISGSLTNDGGSILFEGEDITRLSPHQRAARGVARSFQIPKPFRSMTVLENLRIPLEYAARRRTERRRIHDDSMEVLELIGLKDRANDNSAGLTQVDMRKLELARALETGCDGVITSGLEAPTLKAEFGDRLLLVTPGIRPVEDRGADDQKRTVDVAQAFANGADYIVVGRPIRDAADPRDAALGVQRTIAELFGA